MSGYWKRPRTGEIFDWSAIFLSCAQYILILYDVSNSLKSYNSFDHCKRKAEDDLEYRTTIISLKQQKFCLYLKLSLL